LAIIPDSHGFFFDIEKQKRPENQKLGGARRVSVPSNTTEGRKEVQILQRFRWQPCGQEIWAVFVGSVHFSSVQQQWTGDDG
jgi:hypothetical protein